MHNTNSALIETDALAARLAHDSDGTNLKIIDATYGGHPYGALFIENTVWFDIDRIADQSAMHPHTIPSAQAFAYHLSDMNIHETDEVIIYDQHGLHMAAARVWWMFRLFGHKGPVRVLNGGLVKWIEEGRATIDQQSCFNDTHYTAAPNTQLLMTIEAMKTNITDPKCIVLDARDAMRFTNGHIDNSINMPFPTLLDETGRCLKPVEELTVILQNLPKRPLCATCGSGVTACVIALALHEIGRKDCSIYDGSWTEWSHNL